MGFLVGVIAGSKSDLPVLEKGLTALDELGISYRVSVCSAHRDPSRLRAIIADWESGGVKIFIAAAGLAAHLPGVIAALTQKPVIGIPINAALSGFDSLLSIVQMPPGVPVATVGVDNSKNAAILAARILALSDDALLKELDKLSARVREDARAEDVINPSK